MRLFGRNREPKPPKPQIPHVWITLNGWPFYVPVTDPFVELCYGPVEARRLREQMLQDCQATF